ncbi:MAG: hypothetical protein WBL44_04380 [Nitrososphaeraceae archaeon]|jgi:hypothetical protein
MLNEKTEERVKEAMEAHGFDVTIENKHIRFSNSKGYVTAYQFAIMQMAGKIEYIGFSSNTIFVKRSEKSAERNDEPQAISSYLPVKVDQLSFEFHCLECRGVLIHKIAKPDAGSLCNNCMRVLKKINNEYESAPTRVSIDPDEVKEYENGDRPKENEKGVSMFFGPSSSK